MRTSLKYFVFNKILILIILFPINARTQTFTPSNFKVSALNQTWFRFSQNNIGSQLMSETSPSSFDIGLRRTRFYLAGNITPKVFVYFQFGQNNFNSRFNSNYGNRKLSAFIHDAWSEYQVFEDRKLVIGGGLTIANGLSRFSQPSIGSIATLDVPIFAQTTVDQIDQFSRKLSVYARGQISKLDYRLILSDPFPPSSSGGPVTGINETSQFSPVGHHLQKQMLLSWNFFEMENHQTPYMTGSYLGKRKVFNLSIGAIFQPKAMYRMDRSKDPAFYDTVFEDLRLWNVESFFELPFKNKSMLHAYAGFFKTDYGKNYLRINGIMNTCNGTSIKGLSTISGAQYGNAVPMFGTGTQFYTEWAYLLPYKGEEPHWMPYLSYQYSKLQALNRIQLNEFHLGLNYYIKGNFAKLTLDYGNRPSILQYNDGTLSDLQRKNSVNIQYQISF